MTATEPRVVGSLVEERPARLNDYEAATVGGQERTPTEARTFFDTDGWRVVPNPPTARA